ncbi:MAG: M23 family metallopeptidase [Phenylobacterium sp.]|uniref:M23 family metallopeptidase n=1 Tax=Phenylobacterium sp. TaxID=1871053 RepID=UPI00391DB0EC
MRPIPLLALALVAGCGPAAESKAPEPPAARPPAGAPSLTFPVACEIGKTCELQNHVDRDPGPGAKDYRCGVQTYEAHGGVDIRVPDMAAQRAGVDVLAAADGRVARLRDGVPDVSIRTAAAASASGQECGNGIVIDHGGGWETQYCHLAQGSLRVKAGDTIAAGQPIARIGLSGNTEYPHLHLTVRRDGVTVDPFAPTAPEGSCEPQAPVAGLWEPAAAKALAYRRGAVLNLGFSGAPVTMEQIEAGEIAAPGAAAPVLVAYGRGVKLEAGDEQEMVLEGPGGVELARQRLKPLERPMAQYFMYVGKRTPSGGWPPGTYRATYRILREGATAASQTEELRL